MEPVSDTRSIELPGSFVRQASRATVLLHPYLIFVVVALVVWLPDGFNIGPVNDGWVGITRIHLVDSAFDVRALQ